MSVLLALASSLLWGIADFLGGKACQRAPTLLVVLISQAAGLLLAVVSAAASRSFAAPSGYLPWAIGAGLAGAGGVLLFYRALAIGMMSIVAPVAALGVIVPVLIGLFGGDLPSILCLAGIVLAVGGVVLSAGLSTSGPHSPRHVESILLAAVAAVAFGFLQYAISGGSKYSTVMTMVGMRAASVPILMIAAGLAVGRAGAQSIHVSQSSQSSQVSEPGQVGLGARAVLGPRFVLFIAVIGFFDMGANLLFANATVSGALAVVAVLGSLYPAATVLLARVVDHERMSRVQNVGVVAAICGVAMISLGS